MKKITVLIFSVITLFVFMIAAVPCFAGKQKNNSKAQQTIGDDGVIFGCYKKVNGQLRVVSGPDDCRPSEESISWNTKGQAGGIDLSMTTVNKCEKITDCFCENGGQVLHGYAECPIGAVLTSAGTPLDATDYGFHAQCMDLAGNYVEPAVISIRCLETSVETNCSDGIDNDGDTAIDCADSDCSNDPACQLVETNCSDGIDNDGDTAIDCADSDCSNDPACQLVLVPVPVETNCSDGQDNDGNGKIDCKDQNCKNDPNCTKKKTPKK
jgi:hypothetical protein